MNHKNVIARHGKNFCAAPFASLFEGADGKVTTCCKSHTALGDSKTQSFEEIFNSPAAKEVRQAFLKGEKHEQCSACWRREEKTGQATHNRITENDIAAHKIDELVADTEADGTLIRQQPVWLDLTWTNRCNFACLGCNAAYSSTIAKNYAAEYDILHDFADKDNRVPELWSNGNQNKVAYIIDHADSIDRIHFSGGEPFMDEKIYELLDEMIKRGLQHRIKIWSHTNGSILNSYKGKNIVDDYLVHWGTNAKISISSDGYGKRGEYIRYGYRDEKWLKNYQRFREAGIDLSIQTCWNVFNSLALEETGAWYMDNCQPDKNGRVQGSLTLWNDLPVSGDLIKFHEPTLRHTIGNMQRLEKNKNCPAGWWSGLKSHLSALCNGAGPVATSKPAAFLKGIEAIDQARGTNFDATFPELLPLKNELIQIVRRTDQTPNRIS